MKIVLASASPRRRELLQMLGLEDFLICPAKGEELPPDHATPEETVCSLASAKARDVLIVPCDDFGCPGYLRLGTCVSTDTVKRALPIFRELIEEK